MTKDPVQVEKKESSSRAFRGGCWSNFAVFLVVSDRGYGSPGYRSAYLGLRLVRNTKG